MFSSSSLAVKKSNFKNTYHLNKKVFTKNPSKSFDYAVWKKLKKLMQLNLIYLGQI